MYYSLTRSLTELLSCCVMYCMLSHIMPPVFKHALNREMMYFSTPAACRPSSLWSCHSYGNVEQARSMSAFSCWSHHLPGNVEQASSMSAFSCMVLLKVGTESSLSCTDRSFSFLLSSMLSVSDMEVVLSFRASVRSPPIPGVRDSDAQQNTKL